MAHQSALVQWWVALSFSQTLDCGVGIVVPLEKQGNNSTFQRSAPSWRGPNFENVSYGLETCLQQ